MERKRIISDILMDLEKTGSNIEYADALSQDCLELVKTNGSVVTAMNEVAQEIKKQTGDFLNQQNSNGTKLITGISTCIYLPDFKHHGEYKLKILGGDISRNQELSVNENTMFDVASITKLFTLILIFKLEEIGMISLDSKISDINSDFQNLEDFTVIDLIRLHGNLRTDGDIRFAQSKEEAYEILKTLYLTSNTRDENTYTDFGAIVLSDTIEKIVSKELNTELKFDEIMRLYLIEPLGLKNTMFNPSTSNISGNGYNTGYVHDPKARILGGAVGSAGLFTTSDDLARLAKHFYVINNINYGIISKKHLSKLGEITFPNSKQSQKGNFGIYVKHPLGFDKTYTPSEFSTGSFSHQGWTGSVATFDVKNGIHQNILVNAIYEDEEQSKVRNDKPVGYGAAFDEYLGQITKNTMLMYLVKKYYARLNRSIDMNFQYQVK